MTIERQLAQEFIRAKLQRIQHRAFVGGLIAGASLMWIIKTLFNL